MEPKNVAERYVETETDTKTRIKRSGNARLIPHKVVYTS